MADENNQNPANPAGNEAPEGQENNGDNDEGQENNGQGEGSGGQSTDKSAEELQAEADKKAQEDAAEPPTRKSKLQYIQERQQRREEKRKNLENQPKTPAPNEKDESEEGEDDELSPEEAKMYQKLEGTFMKKHADKFEKVDSFTQQAEVDAVNNEISEFLKNDEYGDILKTHEAKIRKYAVHPSRAQVPIEELVYGIIGKDAFALGAKQAREAMKKANASRNGGSSARKPEGATGKDYASMSKEEFEKEQQAVLQGR